MNTVSFASIEPLILDIQESGRSVQVTFQCPLSNFQVMGRGSVSRDNSIANQTKDSIQRSLMYSLQNALAQAIRSAFGYNILGRVASDVARQTVRNTSSNLMNGLSASERQEAIVKAFQSVQRQFTWDEGSSRWISAQGAKDTMSPFDQQRQAHPINHPYDRQILARMLVQVSMADGQIARAEREWLVSFLTPDMGDLDTLLQKPALSVAELQQTSVGGGRETMLMLAWSMALCDEEFAEQERSLLHSFAGGLGLSMTQRNKVESLAQGYILEQLVSYLYGSSFGNPNFARQQVLDLAKRLQIPEAFALEIEAKTHRRLANF